MIKKILGFLVVGLSFICFSNAGTVQTVGLQESPSIYNNQYDITFLKGGAFKSMFLGQGKSILALNSNLLFFRTNDGKLYYFNNGEQGYFGEYRSCDEITGLNYDIGNSNCSSANIEGDYKLVFKNFFQNVKAGDYVYYNVEGGIYDTFWDRKVNICFSNSVLHKSLCFLYAYCNSIHGMCNGGYGDLSFWNYGTLTGSLNLTSDTTFANISQSLLGYAPGQYNYYYSGSIDDYNSSIDPTSEESAINYFESSYGRNESICYAGINDCTTLYGSPVSFNEGNGLNIFQLYQCIYSGNSDPGNVYVWMNTWLLNYNQWVKKNGNPDYLATYNTGTNQVDLYFTGFSSPFVGNPVALYFLIDNIESYNSGLWDDQSWGNSEELVGYCNIKVNSGTFDDITNDNVKKNIVDYTENYNVNKGYNPDGSKQDIDYTQFGSYSGINFSGNTSVQDTLSGFFSEISNAVDVVSFTTSNRILPAFIVNAFIFVVLFKLLRKK